MDYKLNDKVKALIDKGVTIPNPLSVDIGDDVDLNNISGNGVTIYSGCKIFGSKTLIMKGTILGQEAPVTVQDCQIGPSVELKGGYFKESVFFEKSNMSYGAHVRDGCILEEEANGAHTVGLKQTILLPFVTLGSLINLCDCLMAGGTSRKDHSEVGSSYIHFNYTPNQDKATASLLGDVPRGVMLNQKPIFLGGQGGLVGPCIIGFGTVIAAGTVFRGDSPQEGKLLTGQKSKTQNLDFCPGIYWEIRRRTKNNIIYIANLIALKAWYNHVRTLFLGADPMVQGLLNGAINKLDLCIDERITRFGAVAKKMTKSVKEYKAIMKDKASDQLIKQEEELGANWGKIETTLNSQRSFSGDNKLKDLFLSIIEKDTKGKQANYISVIQGLSKESSETGTIWLQNIVDEVSSEIYKHLPSFKQ